MSEETEETVKAVRARLKTQEAFPPGDPLSILLLRLMAATNDVRQLQRLVLITLDPDAQPISPAERLVQSGEAAYFGRLFFGHLYEAGKALRSLDEQYRAEVNAAVARDRRAAAALDNLRAVFGNTTDEGFYRRVLGRIRNVAAFHYKENEFRERLEGITGDTELVIAEYEGFSRYAVTDALLDAAVVAATGGSPETVRQAVEVAVDLSDQLAKLVARLVPHFLERRPDSWHPGEPEKLRVPPALAAVARRAARRR